jgi:hypothetical protein
VTTTAKAGPNAEALRIINQASTFKFTDPSFQFPELKDPDIFYTSDQEAYDYIIKDLDNKTSNSKEVGLDFINLVSDYFNIETSDPVEKRLLEFSENYYVHYVLDKTKAEYIPSIEEDPFIYIESQEIACLPYVFKDDYLVTYFIARKYTPLYLWVCYNKGITPTPGGLIKDLMSKKSTEVDYIWEARTYRDLDKQIPQFQTLYNLGYGYGKLKDLDISFVYSTPIYCTDELIRDFKAPFNNIGEEIAYIIPVKDVKNNKYGYLGFDKNHNFINYVVN